MLYWYERIPEAEFKRHYFEMRLAYDVESYLHDSKKHGKMPGFKQWLAEAAPWANVFAAELAEEQEEEREKVSEPLLADLALAFHLGKLTQADIAAFGERWNAVRRSGVWERLPK